MVGRPIDLREIATPMSGSELVLVLLIILAGIAAVILIGEPIRRPRVYMIDATDLIRVEEARRSGSRRQPKWAWRVIVALVLASLVWGLLV